MPPMSEPEPGEGLWVRSEVLPDGSYAVTVSVGSDRVWVLDREAAQRYATAAVAAAQHAEYDAAIFAMFTGRLGLEPPHAAEFLGAEVRPDRAPPDAAATAPLTFLPGVNAAGQPFLHIHLDGTPWGQLDPVALRAHAMTVLEAPTAADLDHGLLQALRRLGLPDAGARECVADIANWRCDAERA